MITTLSEHMRYVICGLDVCVVAHASKVVDGVLFDDFAQAKLFIITEFQLIDQE